MERPIQEQIERAQTELARYTQTDVERYQTLQDLLVAIPPIAKHLVTLLRAYDTQAHMPPNPPYHQPVYSIERDISDGRIGLSGRDEGVAIKKWDRSKNVKEIHTTSSDEFPLLFFSYPNVLIEVPTIAPYVLNAVVNREITEYLYPVQYPDDAQVQQKYASYLQELIADLLTSLRK